MLDGVYVCLVMIMLPAAVIAASQIFFLTRVLYALFFAELALFGSYRSRTRAFARAISSFHGRAWYMLLTMALVFGSSRFVAPMFPLVPASFPLFILAFTVIPLAVATLVCYWVFRSRIRRSLRQQLVERGYTICLHCGYDLRGQAEPRCPECGLEFDQKLLQGENQSG